MPRLHFPWSDSIPEPDPEPEPTPAPPMPPIFGQPAPPAQPLDTPLPDDPWANVPLPALTCIICGASVPAHLDAFCARHETVADVAFAVYCGELSEWPGQCVNDRVMLATHPKQLGLHVVPWQATVTAILSAAGVWLEDGDGGE